VTHELRRRGHVINHIGYAISDNIGTTLALKVIRHFRPRYAWWLRPLAEAMGRDALAQRVIWTNDTPIRVLAPGCGKTREVRIWVYAHDPRPWGGTGLPLASFRYSADRKGERPQRYLTEFRGWLQADGYAGYNALWRPQPGQLPVVQHAASWAHARRFLSDEFERTQSSTAVALSGDPTW
jgi:transposase